MLEISYLQHRIEFLEKSLTVVLGRHQIRGLHFLRTRKREEEDRNFRDHGFRKRFERFIKIKGSSNS